MKKRVKVSMDKQDNKIRGNEFLEREKQFEREEEKEFLCIHKEAIRLYEVI